MSARTTVLFFHTASDSFGGGSQMLFRLLKSINTDEFEPVVLSQYRDELCQRVQKCGIRVEVISFRGILDTYNRGLLSLSPVRTLQTGLRIGQFNLEARQLLREADVIWCKNLRSLLTLGPYTLVSRTPIIWNIGLGLKSEGKVRYLNSVALRLADRVFIESREQAKSIFTARQYERYESTLTVFHKGVDIERFCPRETKSRDDSPLRVGTAASLTPRKGLEYFIDAAAEIEARTENEVEFLIAGEPSAKEDKTYVQSLHDKTEEMGLDGTIQFLGWVEEMPNYFASLDVFVLPSLNEGIPGTVREALAMGVPVVATDVGGTEEVVKNGETGFLIEAENATAITDAVGSLLSNRQTRSRMGENGRELVVERFSMESYVKRYESFLRELSTGAG